MNFNEIFTDFCQVRIDNKSAFVWVKASRRKQNVPLKNNADNCTNSCIGIIVNSVNGILNSLAPGRSECDFKNVIFNFVLLIGLFRFS